MQVVKPRIEKHLSIERRIVQGTANRVAQLLQRTQNGGVINTAFIERLNATFHQRLTPLARPTRALAQCGDTLCRLCLQFLRCASAFAPASFGG